jgi:hypothetical protein
MSQHKTKDWASIPSMCKVELGRSGARTPLFPDANSATRQGRMVFTVLIDIVLCPFSHILVAIDTSIYALVQDVSLANNRFRKRTLRERDVRPTRN